MLTGLPLFVHRGLGFAVPATAVWLAAMYASRAAIAAACGRAAQQLLASEWCSRTVLRKAGCVVCTCGRAVGFVGVPFLIRPCFG